MKNFQKYFVKTSVAVCIIACLGDIMMLFVFGNLYPGYNQLKDTMSSLGASKSPVSDVVSAWWIIVGILIAFFGVGMLVALRKFGKNGILAAWLVVIYGLGEEMSSGFFKMDRIEGKMTNLAIFHEILSGIGVLAIICLPFVMKKIFSKELYPGFYKFSTVIIAINFSTWLLFGLRISEGSFSFLGEYKGLWQRMMLINIYLYLVAIAIFIFNFNTNESDNIKIVS